MHQIYSLIRYRFAYLHGGGPNKGDIDSELARVFSPCLQKIKDKEKQMQKESS
jgi:hypothetical protein